MKFHSARVMFCMARKIYLCRGPVKPCIFLSLVYEYAVILFPSSHYAHQRGLSLRYKVDQFDSSTRSAPFVGPSQGWDLFWTWLLDTATYHHQRGPYEEGPKY